MIFFERESDDLKLAKESFKGVHDGSIWRPMKYELLTRDMRDLADKLSSDDLNKLIELSYEAEFMRELTKRLCDEKRLSDQNLRVGQEIMFYDEAKPRVGNIVEVLNNNNIRVRCGNEGSAVINRTEVVKAS